MIGKMDKKITFQAPSSTPIGGAGYETVYSNVLTTFCEAKPLSSSRDLAAHQTVLKNGYRFKIRYREAFSPSKDMLIIYKGRQFTINSIEPDADDRDKFWLIMGIEKV